MRLKKDRYRPLLHFTPSKGWTNDPNGLVWYNGWYHLFYQYNPDSTVWGPMHWGHARSRNLIRWQHLPIALHPDDDGMIFSGSAAVDTDNLTGWNRHRPGMLAMYTLHGHQEQQAIAWSDNGRKFRKFERNPVIANPGLPDFRDPKLFRVAGDKGWHAVLAAGDRVCFYYSKDLQRWRKSGEYTYKGSDFLHNGIWECPDMVLLPAPDGNQYWVLLLSVNMDKSDGGSRECYWIGSFENGTFVPMESAPDPRWLDEGADFYAGVTYNQTPHGRKVMIGWMNNWVYAAKIPADDFRGAMTIPRELRLVYAGHRLVLAQNPIEELKRFRGAYADFDTQQQGGEVEIPLAKDSFEIELQNEGAYACELMNDAGDSLVFGMNDRGEVYIDRSRSGRRDFSEDFYPKMVSRCVSAGDLHQARAVFDVQSLEVFFDDGRQTMTALAFPRGRYTLVRIRGSVHGTLYISVRP